MRKRLLILDEAFDYESMNENKLKDFYSSLLERVDKESDPITIITSNPDQEIFDDFNISGAGI